MGKILYTSCFSKVKSYVLGKEPVQVVNTKTGPREIDFTKVVSIAGRAPKWYGTRRTYKKLAPKLKTFLKYKLDKNSIAYTASYWMEVLNKLDPDKVYDVLGDKMIMLCWEPDGEFCHRQLIRKWFQQHTDIQVIEI